MSRRSMSLSPIRTESGANLRTANWTRMKFKTRGNTNFGNKQNYYNNRNYHHDNRNYHHDNNRYHHNNYRNNFKRNFRRDDFYDNRRSRSRSRSRRSSRSLSWSSGNRSPAKNLNQSKAKDLLEPSKWDSPKQRNESKFEDEGITKSAEIKNSKLEKNEEEKKSLPTTSQHSEISAPTMAVVDAGGNLVEMVCVEIVGPDGRKMKVLKMPQDAAPTTKEASPVATEPVPTATEEVLGEKVDRAKYEAEKAELEEKQRRRKEIIRTRLWPRPATWKENGNTDNKDSKDLTWALDVKTKNNVIPGLGDSPRKEEKEEYLNEMDFIGHKIPTLGNSKISYPEIKPSQSEYAPKFESGQNVAQLSNQQTFGQQLQTSYPNIGQGYQQIQYTNPVAPPVAGVRPPVEDLRHPVASKWESPDVTKIQSYGKKFSGLSSSEEEKLRPPVEVESSSEDNQKKKKKKKKRKASTSEKKKKKKKKKEMSVEKSTKKSSKEEKGDDITRSIAGDLPLSHIRSLVARRPTEGTSPVFAHVPGLSRGCDSYETQFVSLFGGSEAKQAPLMSRKILKKTKITVSGSRSVTHMTQVSLSERISNIGTEEKKEENKQTVSVNLDTLDLMKMGKNRSRSPGRRSRSKKRSSSRSKSGQRSAARSRSKQRSLDRSRSKQKSEPLERSPAGRSRSPGERSRSPSERSRSKSLPRAYNSQRSSSRESVHRRLERNRNQSRSPQRGYQQRNYNHYNQRYRGRGRGFRGRWNNYYNNNNRGRGFHNNNWRGKFQNNFHDNRQRNNPNFSAHLTDRRFQRSRSRSFPRDKSRSVSPPKKMKMEESSTKDFYKVRKSSPAMDTHQWTHDKFEEGEKEEN